MKHQILAHYRKRLYVPLAPVLRLDLLDPLVPDHPGDLKKQEKIKLIYKNHAQFQINNDDELKCI